MKHSILIFIILLSYSSSAQDGFTFSVGVGGNYSWGNLEKIQGSLDSYFDYLDGVVGSEAYTRVDNWTPGEARPHYMIRAGYELDNFAVGLSYSNIKMSQERIILTNSGYGRQFNWNEQRSEWIVDFGWKSKRLECYGLVGANIANYKMAVYQIYPDGTRSINGEYRFNGLYKQMDVGMSYGLGTKLKLHKRFAIDLRYLISSDGLLGEPEEALTLTDNSFGRSPSTSELPADYTQPNSFDNAVIVGVKRSLLKLTFLYQIISPK